MFGLKAAMPQENGRGNVGSIPPAAEPLSKALIVPDNNQGSTAEVARFLPIMDIEQAVARRNVMVEALQRLMKEGVDYGKVGDGKKPSLLQPGADKLCNLFGLTLKYRFLEKQEDWSGERHNGEPFFYYQIGVDVFRGDFQIGEGVGSCSSRESKYRWRKSERACPVCTKENIRKSRETGWYCWAKTGGCGATFSDGDPAIEGQAVGRKLNTDIEDQVNTILKIAYKRAKVSGTINATSASEFFTQDVEDFTPPNEDIDIGHNPPNSRAAQQHVAHEKLRTGNVEPISIAWKNMGEIGTAFQAMRQEIGETAWLEELERYGFRDFASIKRALDAMKPGSAKEALMAKVTDLYRHLLARREGK